MGGRSAIPVSLVAASSASSQAFAHQSASSRDAARLGVRRSRCPSGCAGTWKGSQRRSLPCCISSSGWSRPICGRAVLGPRRRPASGRGAGAAGPGAVEAVSERIRHAVAPCVVGSWRRDGTVTRSGAAGASGLSPSARRKGDGDVPVRILSTATLRHRFGASLHRHRHYRCCIPDGMFDPLQAGGVQCRQALALAPEGLL